MLIEDAPSDHQIQLLHLLDDWKKKNIQTGYEITAQIQTLDVQLRATQKRISDLHGDSFWKELHDRFSRLTSKVHQVSQCHMIIASLRYDCMEIRQSSIREAHERTFTWMFVRNTHDPSIPQLHTEFKQWLQHGSGIYWITGKPGEFGCFLV